MISARALPLKESIARTGKSRADSQLRRIGSTTDFPSRILIVVADESRFEFLRSLCLTPGDGTATVHWLSHYETARDASLRETYDVVILDYGHHGFRLLRDMARVGSDTAVIMLVDEAVADHDTSGVICKFLPRGRLDAGRLKQAIREVVRRAAANRAASRSQDWWRQAAPRFSSLLTPAADLDHATAAYPTVALAPPPTVLHGARADRSPFPDSNASGSNVLLTELLDHLPIVAAQIDDDGTVLDCAGSGLKSVNLTPAVLRGKNVFDHPQFPAAAIRQAMRGTPVMAICTWTGNGRPRHFECHFRFDNSRQCGALGFAYDVTDRVEAERARASREQMLAGVMEHLPAIVGRVDAQGKICEIGGTGWLESGPAGPELKGARFADVFPEGRSTIAAALSGQPGRFEAAWTGDPNRETRLEFHVSFDQQNHGGAVFFGQDVTRHRRLEYELLHAVDAERQRLGAELHDEVGQLLTGITCLSTALAERLRNSHDPGAEEAATITEVTREALAQTRALARGLAPVRLAQHGLADALANLRTQVLRMHEIDLRLHLPEAPLAVNGECTGHLFRIAQEAITNAIRHGEAAMIEVTVEQMGDTHRLVITDNGHGLDPKKVRRAEGSGLGLMEYRAALIGGRLKISSGPETGTRIEVCFPSTQPCPHENAR